MPVYPRTPRSAFLNWAQAHFPVWVTNQATIGLTAAQATAFKNAVGAAATAEAARVAAAEAAKTATQTATQKFAALNHSAAEMVRTIKTFAENSGNVDVYNLAQIPAPVPSETAPPPGQPTNLTVTLMDTGALQLHWKSNNPTGTSGTSYIIRRKLPTEAEFSFVGVSGSRKFVDNTFPAGPDSVQYTVQGQRADSAGAVSAAFTVYFGRNNQGQTVAFVGGANTAKLAA